MLTVWPEETRARSIRKPHTDLELHWNRLRSRVAQCDLRDEVIARMTVKASDERDVKSRRHGSVRVEENDTCQRGRLVFAVLFEGGGEARHAGSRPEGHLENFEASVQLVAAAAVPGKPQTGCRALERESDRAFLHARREEYSTGRRKIQAPPVRETGRSKVDGDTVVKVAGRAERSVHFSEGLVEARTDVV